MKVFVRQQVSGPQILQIHNRVIDQLYLMFEIHGGLLLHVTSCAAIDIGKVLTDSPIEDT